MNPLSAGDPLRLGPYRLLGTLGAGGMGKVYFGRDNAGRTAAVKVLHPELSHDLHLAQRFVREAVTAQAVTSNGVARVLGAQLEGGRPWIAAEFLAGPTLEEAIAAYGPLDEAGLRVLATALARTLQDIHAAGLVHRDLKPSNVVLTSAGPRVIDFGIARPEHGLTLTTTGQIPVTPGYGAPEQVLGQRVGPAADVFSLGALLAYAASGIRAYDGPHVAGVQYQVVHGDPDLRHVPDGIRALLLPCLAKDPAHRPLPAQMVQAFAPPRRADRIWRTGPLAEEIRRREESAASLASTLARTDGAAPTRRRLLVSLAGGGTALGVAGAGAWWFLRDPAPPKKPVIPAAAERPVAAVLKRDEELTPLWGPVTGADSRTPAPLPVRDVVVFGSTDGGLAAHRVTDGKQKWTAPEALASAGFLTAADRLVLAADAEGSLSAFIASTGEQVWSVPVSVGNLLASDGRAVYVMTEEGQLQAVVATTGKVLWSVPTPVRTSRAEPPAAAAAKGRLVLFPSDGNVIALDTATGKAVWDLDDQGTSAVTPAVIGDKVFLGGKTLTSRLLADGKELWSVPAESREWGPPAVRGNEMYAVDYDLHRLRTDDGKEEWNLYMGGRHDAALPPVVQGGTVWIAESGDDGLIAANTRSGEEVFEYSKMGFGPYVYSGDGNRVFVAHAGSVSALPVRP
ncbi:PQQ-binding-like beta-propeller repeat protein [Streptomyces sp. PKU-EA00015]|uniref:protein kinase domain-containing protein n=1 Tax=Streptomyces sp. PKU-EA00015 TaxID=2748326 RepID=UPI0015A35FA4|nr:PQQ-binding-like beta-propeller repeat protein [Streptomyces sp. PKU-EA00015]NWF28831.1 PQQ-binding-like beta-propeller repeat protein [Streptomyces sp. PKU-EA00015]